MFKASSYSYVDLSKENYNMTTHTHTCTHAHNISMVRRLQLIQ